MFSFQHCAKQSIRFRGILEKIPRDIQEDSGESSRRFSVLLLNLLGNVIKDSRECSRGFPGMFEKFPGNLNFDLFLEILLVFQQSLLLNCYKTMEKKHLLGDSSKENLFSTTTHNYSSQLNFYFSQLFFSFSFLSFLCWGKRVITVKRGKSLKKPITSLKSTLLRKLFYKFVENLSEKLSYRIPLDEYF